MDEKQRFTLFTRALRQAGLRLTPQRQAICHYLARTESHPSPYQVYAAISEAHPEISRATVYNTLNKLQQLGAVVELSFGAGQVHYETNPEPHINLICLRCHRIEDFAGTPALGAFDQRILEETGFQAATAKMDLVGFCAACREQRLAEIRAQHQDSRSEGPQHQGQKSD